MIPFLKYKWLYFLISTGVILSGIFSIVKFGFIYSIDFVGGTDIEYKFDKPIGEKKVQEILKTEKLEYSQFSVEDNVVKLRLKPIDEKKEAQLKNALAKKLKVKVQQMRFETVGPVIGKETLQKTLIASVLAIFGILVYMSFAFKGIDFALAAILAMIHDFFVVVGTYSIISWFFGAQVDLMFVTAVLTTMSFSVHDTIVIFDKIREYIVSEGKGNIEHYANKALTETMVRSLNNSMTIIFMLLSLILLGGSTIRFFIIALLIGTITGTYSSPFVATPILVWLHKRKK